MRCYVSCGVCRAEDVKDFEAGCAVVGMTPERFAFDAADRSLREPGAGQNIQTAQNNRSAVNLRTVLCGAQDPSVMPE